MGGKKSGHTQAAGAPKWDIAFNDAAIDRVLKKIGETTQGANLTKGVNRGELAKKLETAEAQWRTYLAAHRASPKHVRQTRAKPLCSLAKAAKHFKRQLRVEVVREVITDSVLTEDIARRWLGVFPTSAAFEAFLDNLDRVIHVAEGSAQTYEYKPANGFRSPKEWFVGTILAPIFKSCFGRKAGQSGGNEHKSVSGTEYGPFTRFAIAVMQEMDEDLSPDIVKRALRPSRRKHKQAELLRER